MQNVKRKREARLVRLLRFSFAVFRFSYPITSSPIERPVPATVLIAAASESQFKSGIFVFAISSTCFAVTVPTLFLFGSADPLAILAARLSRIAAGGVFVINV